ncbi:PDZ domain-containing protein [Virgibacillus sp. MSJ-26]|uniref:S41 family peptidase n=1 Tax=Virgibacillus sp. MSJ-26 TaxID=2841522 RepID=UPI001C119CA4|nr:S41 family peptidase [Virgibacillus sp. MSJ-26]MBU5467780.1 PDZ domain-containing protein [Virgibacillus sp. MSJ-26]
MKLNKKQIGIVLISALLLGFIGAYLGVNLAQSNQSANPGGQPGKEIPFSNEKNSDSPEDMEKVSQAYSLIKEHFIEDIGDQDLIEGAIQGMLTSLDDPYSTYMDVEEMEEFNEQIESSFEGIGAEVSMVNGNVTIVAPIKDSPAEKAGLRPNDEVLKVDEEALEGYDLNEAVNKIRGEKGSEVVLTIQRSGASKPFEVTLVRDKIPIETVYSELDESNGKKTGILEVTNFSEHTAEEFNEQLEELESKKIDGLVIDVRGNPGGLLNSVEDILELFVPKDIPYIQIEDKEGNKEKYYTELDKKKDYPINVLVNEGSASASEILAVAMKEIGYDIVGTTSFGKGTVQQAVPLGDGSTVKLTFYKWLSPEGNWINEDGVEPTVEIDQPDYYYANPVQLEETLKLDTASDNLENIQVMLKGLGYDPGRTDGYFNKETQTAVEKFQQDNDLKKTGEIDEETAGVIEAKLIENIREGKDDEQLEKALDTLY